MDEQPIIPQTLPQPPQTSQTSVPLTFFSKNKRILIIISVLIILVILIPTSMIMYTKYINTTKTSAINEQFISVPSKDDNILDSLPKKIEPGIIYFYRNTKYGVKGEIASYLKSKIVDIDKTQKSLSVESTGSATRVLITTKDYTIVESIKFNATSNSKPDVKNISFDNLEIGDNISVSSLQHINQNYIAGFIVKGE